MRTSFEIGVVLSLHMRDSMAQFGAKALLPELIVLSLIKESGPIITALVVSGRVGAGTGAELGSMKVTEQIDAIEASAVNPYKFLVVTRVLACMRSEEHTSELQSLRHLVCRLLLEKKKI